jgi:hypothetical protein
MIEVEITNLGGFTARLEDLTASMSLRVVDAMYAIVNVVAQRARDRMAMLFQNPARMQASVATAVEVTSDVIVGTIGAYDLPYLRIQEFGGVTSPHDILPVNAQALAFFSPGGFMPFRPGAATGDMVFAKVVHHPGSKIPERSYMRSALFMEKSNIIQMIENAVRPRG